MPNKPTDALLALAEREVSVSKVPRCADFDSDCDSVPDKVHCWLYDPAKGYCPYLRTLASQGAE